MTLFSAQDPTPEPLQPADPHQQLIALLSCEQKQLLNAWVPDWRAAENLSWGIQPVHVFRITGELRLREARKASERPAGEDVRQEGAAELILKFAEEIPRSSSAHPPVADGSAAQVLTASQIDAQSHLSREIRAFQKFLPQHEDLRRPQLIAADASASILLMEYLEGELALGSAWEEDPQVWESAGASLAGLGGPLRTDESFDAGQLSSLRRRLDGRSEGLRWNELAWTPSPYEERALSERDGDQRESLDCFAEWAADHQELLVERKPISLEMGVTHGDFSPRNWIVLGSPGSAPPHTALIDFGRCGIRPWFTELDQIVSADPHLLQALERGWGLPCVPSAFSEQHFLAYLTYRISNLMGTLEWALRYRERSLYTQALQGAEGLMRAAHVQGL